MLKVVSLLSLHFLYQDFAKALHDFTLMSKDHVEPLQKSVAQSLKNSPKHLFKQESAIGMLEEEGVVTVKSNDNNRYNFTWSKLSSTYNQS